MENAKKFALIGAAGFVAPRHLKAIKETGNVLLAALDKSDNVGILDSYFPDTHFFTEFERFDRYLHKLRRKGTWIDFISICSPNYLHDSHIRYALRQGSNAICEKPLVLNPWNIEALYELEKETGKKIYTILQLRLHPRMIALKKEITSGPKDKIYEVVLTYITSRGNWYHHSWKGDTSKSGGIATNIGVHFFDILQWIFGEVGQNVIHIHNAYSAAGYLELSRARVRWFLSINADDLPETAKKSGQRTYRSITLEGKEIEFSEGFTDLHTQSYWQILQGGGFELKDAEPSIQIVYDIRNSTAIGLKGKRHSFAK
jgi:UDP-N-acetyl-2-amino-2-deoxyglucuronate dehydrogenase